MTAGVRGLVLRVVVAVAAGVALAAPADRRSDLPWLPPAAETVDAFAAALAAGDFEALETVVTEDSAQGGIAGEVKGALEDGAVETLEVERTASVQEPSLDEPPAPGDEINLAVPYAVEYVSEAAPDPVRLEGDLPLAYDSEEDAWEVVWDRSLLWPGVQGAAGFEVSFRWPERADIVDRDREVLAGGDGASRSYPFGSVGGNIVGHLEPAPEGDATGKELVGASGVEAAFEDRLAGQPGSRLAIVDEAGDVVETLGRSRPRAAKPLRITLDVDVQQATENAFGGTLGGAVVLDPATGDILAAASGAFDPNAYLGVAGIEPFNRALAGLYPPGSSMKVVTAAAGLDTGEVTESTELTGVKEYRGVRNFEKGNYGTVDFAFAVRNSVNTAFAQLAERLGADVMTEYAEAFGFNIELEIPLETGLSSFPYPEEDYDLLWGSIGQARVLATPLQMASVAATIANGGRRMEPRISLEDDPNGERIISAESAETMNRLMQGVVESGTGVNARISGVAVAGKTGTAEVDVDGKRREHAWFIAFAPADDPTIAVAVVSELGGVGGQVAAPLARAVIESVLPLVP